MSSVELLNVFNGLAAPRVLVLGDLILDRYTHGDAERVSQEAPILVLRAEQREERLGGAANVSHMLRGLEASVSCAGVVGDDEAGVAVGKLLNEVGVATELLLTDPSRPTTVKERFIGRVAGLRPGQILRVDHEVRDPLEKDLVDSLVRRIEIAIHDFDVVLISDYAKGFCTPALTQAVIAAARKAGKPVLVDPQRGGDYRQYRNATLLKPNRLETELAIGRKVATPDDAIEAGRKMCIELDLDLVVITLDRQGMALMTRDGAGELFPTRARSIYDITGAGDMVLAMLGAAIGGGTTAAEAVQLANIAAGLEVEQPGVAVIHKSEIRAELTRETHTCNTKIVSADEAGTRAAEHRCLGKRVVFTNGCFDLLHVGHVTYLAAAAAHGDVLIVGMNSDASVRRLKGELRPIITQTDRAAVLAALACVDYVVIFDEDTPHNLLHTIRPEVLIKGGTYSVDEVVGKEIVEAYGGQVRVVGAIDGISTTRIIESATDLVRPQTAESSLDEQQKAA